MKRLFVTNLGAISKSRRPAVARQTSRGLRSIIGECLPGPFSVYGPVTEHNLLAARDPLLRYKATYMCDFVRLWIAYGPEFRHAAEEEYEKLRGEPRRERPP